MRSQKQFGEFLFFGRNVNIPQFHSRTRRRIQLETFVAVSVAAMVFFVLGVIFHKYVVSEAQAIREHFTEEVSGMEGRLRADLEAIRTKLPRIL
jgi:hypothetical protein